ncbi:hypothetical protein H5410_042996 [Solanum commersonii]|uniref:Uncharacterized protein n=1 Tax=Solanum commersonii TaxID=4109 RepID=A0A9J5XXL1_SOLCO|nr:hypothetical protein H5410_042996 [Solanum commersonii]
MECYFFTCRRLQFDSRLPITVAASHPHHEPNKKKQVHYWVLASAAYLSWIALFKLYKVRIVK